MTSEILSCRYSDTVLTETGYQILLGVSQNLANSMPYKDIITWKYYKEDVVFSTLDHVTHNLT